MPQEDSRLLPEDSNQPNWLWTYIQSIIDSVKKNKTIVAKIASNAISTTAQAVNTTANALQFTEFHRSYVATETTTTQSMARNVPGGAMLALAQWIAELLGKFDLNNLTLEQKRELRDLMIAGYGLCVAYTAVSGIAYTGCALAYGDKDTTDYLMTSAAASWPILASSMLSPVVFAHDHWLAAALSSVAIRIASAGSSYLFSDETPLGVLGIGVGNAVGPWLIYAPFVVWMMRQKTLQHLRITKIGDEDSYCDITKSALKKFFWPLTALSLKIGSQRAAEWVNLWIIAKVIAVIDIANLTAVNPSTQLLAILNLFSQGIGIAVNLLLKPLIVSLSQDNVSPEDKERNFKKIQSICKYSLIIPTMLYAGIATAIYFERANIANFFLTKDEVSQNRSLTELLLWINAISLPADTIRLISSGALNPFGHMVKQNLWSIFLMTALGIPVSLISLINQNNEVRMMTIFAVRATMILASGLVNVHMLWRAMEACRPKQMMLPRETETPAIQDRSDTVKIAIAPEKPEENTGVFTRMASGVSSLLWKKEEEETETAAVLLNGADAREARYPE